MSLFRRREPLHVRLAREGGLLDEKRPPHDTMPRWGESGIHGVHRLREWDEVTMVEADGPVESPVDFVVLPGGSVAGGDPDEAELAAGVELAPPYRARAVQRGERLWAVGARRIQVVRFEHPGEEIELTSSEGARSLVVDGAREFGSLPALEPLLEGDGVVRARRLEGDLWEIRVDRL